MKRTMIRSLVWLLALVLCLSLVQLPALAADAYWGSSSDNGDGTYDNDACVDSDTPDPDIIRVGDAYYMTSTSMHFCPGVPIMKSYDLVNWEVVSYVYNVLADYNQLAMRNGQYDYGKGSWATSLRYREYDHKFYLSHTCNTTNKTYFYSTDDIEHGTWDQIVCNTFYHDGSLLFEGEDIYMFSGSGTISVDKLKPDFSGSEWKKSIITSQMTTDVCGRNNTFLEATHAYKVGDTYYVFMCTWPSGAGKQQLVWKSKTVDGPYEGKVIIDDSYGRSEGLAQGGIVDLVDGSTQTSGKWMGFFMHLRGAAGRGLALTPCTFDADGWPVVANSNRKATRSARETKPIAGDFEKKSIVNSTEFDNAAERPAWTYQMPKDTVEPERYAYNGSNLPMGFEWNHMPDNRYWSLTERPGFLRLTNGSTATSMTNCRNVLTARTFGPQCWGHVAMEIDGMRDGDIAGFGAFHRSYGYLAVRVEGDKKYIVYRQRDGDSQDSSFSNNDPWLETVLEELDPSTTRVYFKTYFDYRSYNNEFAYFYYSTDSVNWINSGKSRKVQFGYPTHFDGCRFGIFNFATKEPGGYVDVDYFELGDTEMKDAPSDHEHQYEEVVTAPGCVEGGYTTATCSICGRSYKHDYTDALGHDWDEGKVTVQPTETTKGVFTYTCRRCGETKTKKLPRLGSTVPDDIDFTNPEAAEQFEIVNKNSAAIASGTGLALTCTRPAFEDCKGQNEGDQATTPEDAVLIPVEGDWIATLQVDFDTNGASNGYYQFFGFYAAEGTDFRNLCGVRGGDGAMQNFERHGGEITHQDEDGVNSQPGFSTVGTYWLRIEKEGDNYVCLRSADGENFTEMFRYEGSGIEADHIVIDAYTGMTTGYKFTLKSLKFEDNGPALNKSALRAAMDAAEAIDQSLYTAESANRLQAALRQGLQAMEEAVEQEHIDAVTEELYRAIAALELKPVLDKTALAAAVEEAEKLDGDKYTLSTYATLEARLDWAKQMLERAELQEQIDDALDALNKAVAALEEIPPLNKAPLQEAIAAAEAMDKTPYTEQSLANLSETLKTVKKILDEATTQIALDYALDLLNGSLSHLVRKDAPVEPFRFDDVKDENQYYYEPVYWAYSHEPQITNGTSRTLFSPETGCTRAQVVTFLWRAAGEPEPSAAMCEFQDVDKGAYYYNAILWAVENNITNGTSKTTFDPQKTCTRAQIVTFLWRAAGKPKPTSTACEFKDVKQGAYYYDAVLWAVEKKITNGTTKTTFDPEETCTRAQIVTFLYRAR